ncbi:glycogen synthase [Tieghemostelium lacteum]|uniref:Glycogen [starch] synthase n=1 Tax=Tieghemostelium lacteum TaxID=361077 RepID=A0A151ZB88_TIELA|nr:glycogen synthase [Tieghemostelium lacteum]|eukprot:KYQ91195.1 glycogen synthase [Tieghemostelium lacteum]
MNQVFGTPNSTFLETRYNLLNPRGSSGTIPQGLGGGTVNEPNTVLFDIGWEVAKKVGGIYTVLKSKAPVTVETFKSSYALIGPYNPETAATEFESLEPGPLSSPIIENMLAKYGIQIHFGKWLIESHPKVFLIDLKSSMHKLSEWRFDLMAGFEQPGDQECNESIVFGYQVALLLKEFSETYKNDKYIAHFHEWQSSVSLILLKRWRLRMATIFTTHATLLGRYLSAGGVDLYNQMHHLNIDSEASKRGIYHRHWIEKQSAHDAHVFTTVSEITAFEAEHILQRKCDVILPNGLKLDKFTALHEFQNLHQKNKQVIQEFVRGHFYGHYDFDLDNTLYFFTAGRNEYFNKGVDMFLDALAGLNKLLQQAGSPITIVAFIIMPSKTNNYNVESLKGQSYLRDTRRTCNSIVEAMGERLFEATSKGQIISPEQLITPEDLVMLKRRILNLKQKSSLPPIVTHNMVDDVNDPILNHIRRIKLFNAHEDRVKIIYHPEFLNSTNPLIPLDYTDFVRGTHLGIFVSYYEPYGYTPCECTALGVPSVTSNLTGFANFMKRGVEDPDSKGIYIVDRRYKSPQESVDQLTQYLWKFCQLDRRQRIELRNHTEKLSELLDWKNLGKFYTTARSLALERAFPIQPRSTSLKVSSEQTEILLTSPPISPSTSLSENNFISKPPNVSTLSEMMSSSGIGTSVNNTQLKPTNSSTTANPVPSVKLSSPLVSLNNVNSTSSASSNTTIGTTMKSTKPPIFPNLIGGVKQPQDLFDEDLIGPTSIVPPISPSKSIPIPSNKNKK